MKKLIILFVCGIILVSLVGCNSNENETRDENNNAAVESKAEEDKTEDKINEETNIADKNSETIKNNPIVTIEELPVQVTILEPNSIGTRYMEATYTNNSKYTIQGLNITILLKDKNEKTYLSTYDTVLPGETSPKFETFAPETGKVQDYEYLVYEITVAKEDGTIVHLSYDVKTDKYTWF